LLHFLVITAHFVVIPAHYLVIPAQAGIQRRRPRSSVMSRTSFPRTPSSLLRTISSFPRRRESSPATHNLRALWVPACAGTTGAQGKGSAATQDILRHVVRPPAPKPGSPEEKAAKKAEKPKREKFKNDPKVVEAARELRDRYIEQINAGLLLPRSACGKYDVSRQLEAAPSTLKQTPLLKAA
jgi:hypothetical protein